MAINRVAIIFDNTVRPDTTGGYCLRALRNLVEVQHFLPSELEIVPRTGFDLYLNIDDGLEYDLPDGLHPCAWWAIDTHLNPEWCQKRSKHFDFVFAAQRDGAEQLQEAGIHTACWLPLACDPEIHRKHEVDIHVREALCRLLFDHAEPAETEQELRQLLRLDPENAAAYHNLGTVHFRLHCYPEAVQAYQESLRHRPNTPGTYVQLGNALRESCRLGEAVSAWQEVLRIDPENQAAKEALRG